MRTRLQIRRALALLATAAATCAFAAPALAAGDRDHDGMPSRWEVRQGLDPDIRSAAGDPDHDGLTNLREYRHGGIAHDEDSDNDGADDGDEVAVFGTDVDDRDSDGDGRVDGEENRDRDRLKNEDEDDAAERCIADDDDRDGDGVADEDEDELGTSVRRADSDHDGIADGNEDADDDGRDNEDEDDHARDACSGDRDHDGEDDEDENDVFGVVSAFDVVTGTLVITALPSGEPTATRTTDETELRWDPRECGGRRDVTAGDLIAEPQVEDFELGDDGSLEKLELVCPLAGSDDDD